MRVWDFSRCLFSISTATALLAACGWGSQPPTAMSQTPGIAPARTTAHHVETTSSSCHNLYSFTGSPDGSKPYASLLDVKGTLYGTTAGGGTNGKVLSLVSAPPARSTCSTASPVAPMVEAQKRA